MFGKAPEGTSRKLGGGGVRAEVSRRGPRLLRSCLGVEISRRNPSEANFEEVRLGIPQTSKKSLQKRFHGEAGPGTVLVLGGRFSDSQKALQKVRMGAQRERVFRRVLRWSSHKGDFQKVLRTREPDRLTRKSHMKFSAKPLDGRN